jgi:hypothetical protein
LTPYLWLSLVRLLWLLRRGLSLVRLLWLHTSRLRISLRLLLLVLHLALRIGLMLLLLSLILVLGLLLLPGLLLLLLLPGLVLLMGLGKSTELLNQSVHNRLESFIRDLRSCRNDSVDALLDRCYRILSGGLIQLSAPLVNAVHIVYSSYQVIPVHFLNSASVISGPRKGRLIGALSPSPMSRTPEYWSSQESSLLA